MTASAGIRDHRPAIDRIRDRIEIDENGCWNYTRAKHQSGYGSISVEGRMHPVHRLTYAHYVAPIPDDLQLDHLCRNRACCNPDHLEAVTPAENNRRGLFGELRTACAHGHPYTEETTFWAARPDRPAGRTRSCRICRTESQRRRRQRKSA